MLDIWMLLAGGLQNPNASGKPPGGGDDPKASTAREAAARPPFTRVKLYGA